jgi:hypothetical protein
MEVVVRAVNVQFPSMRRDVMFALAALADREYQESVWLGRRPRPGYADDLGAAVNVLYDDCQVLPNPTDRLGSVLVDGDELERLRHVDTALDVLLADHRGDDDQAFLDDPRWGNVVDAAGRALAAMVISGGFAD